MEELISIIELKNEHHFAYKGDKEIEVERLHFAGITKDGLFVFLEMDIYGEYGNPRDLGNFIRFFNGPLPFDWKERCLEELETKAKS